MTKPTVLSLGELLWDMLPTGKRAGGTRSTSSTTPP